MDVHPWTNHEIATARHEERILRGLAAYQALRVREEQAAEAAASEPAGRVGILDRLLRREAAVTSSSARPAV